MLDADTLNKAICSSHVLHYLFVRIYYAQHIALAYRSSCRATNIDFPPASFDCYRAQVFDGCLGTVAGTARDGKLHLVRRFDALEASLDLNTQVRTIAHPVATKLGSHAGFTGTERLGIGMAGGYAQILQDRW